MTSRPSSTRGPFALLVSTLLAACRPEILVELAGTGEGRVQGAYCSHGLTESGNRIECPGQCATSVEDESPFCFRATPSAGSTFVGWSADCRRSVEHQDRASLVANEANRRYLCRATFDRVTDPPPPDRCRGVVCEERDECDPSTGGCVPIRRDAGVPLDAAVPMDTGAETDRGNISAADVPDFDVTAMGGDRPVLTLDLGLTPDAGPPDAGTLTDQGRDARPATDTAFNCPRPVVPPADAGSPVERGIQPPCGTAGFTCSAPFACTPRGTCESATTDEVLVPAGTFWMGCNTDNPLGQCVSSNSLRHLVTHTRRYAVDRTEVTVSAYDHCVRTGPCSLPNEGRSLASLNYGHPCGLRHPVNHVTRAQAAAYCAWVGRRLCTEAEWERAARGGCETVAGDCRTGMRSWPWGNRDVTGRPDACAFAYTSACPRPLTGTTVNTQDVLGAPLDESPYGARDMGGSVSEWVSDWFEPYTGMSRTDPTGPETSATNIAVSRGGSLNDTATGSTLRQSPRANASSQNLGFRCCRSVP